MIRDSKGSTLLWAITIIMVLMITIAGGLTISYSYFQRSIQNNNKRQAYLTAKSIIENIVEKIEEDDSEYVKLIPQIEGNSVTLTIQLPEEANLGKVTKAVITRKEIEIFCFFRCFPFDMLIPFYPFLTIFHCNPQKEHLPLTILT